jgi:hypothetical protein
MPAFDKHLRWWTPHPHQRGENGLYRYCDTSGLIKNAKGRWSTGKMPFNVLHKLKVTRNPDTLG